MTWRPADDREAAILGDESAEVPVPVGCARCQGRGYAGRVGIFELLWIDEELARLLARGVSEGELRAAARDRVELLRTDGFEKVRAGVTTIDEVAWATVAEE
jgi:type IV pilus assembly protein PilB